MLDISRISKTAFTIATLLGATQAHAYHFKDYLPYFGVNGENRQLEFVTGFGDPLFAKSIPETNVYAGFEMNPYLNLEFGYEFSPTVTRTTATSGQMFLGRYLPRTATFISENRIKFNGTYVNLLGKIPLVANRAHVFISAGLNALKVSAKVSFIGNQTGIFYNPALYLTEYFEARRIIPQFSAGLSANLNKQLQVRLSAAYQLTSKFKNVVPRKEAVNELYRLSLKNATIFRLGLTYEFQ